MAIFQRIYEQACLGRPQALLLRGPPGIGKTRLAEELAEAARNAGAVVVSGSWREGVRLPEYWVWRQVLRGILAAHPLARLGIGLDSALSELSSQLPDLKDRIPNLPPPFRDASVNSRIRLFDAVYRLTGAACERQPLFILLDNLHLTEAASLELLAGFLNELPASALMVVGTFRDLPVYRREPHLSYLAEARRHSAVHECALENLRPGESAGLARCIMGRRQPKALLAEIHAITDGNPLFVRETARLCKERGFGTLERGRLLLDRDLPAAIGSAIGQRLRRLAKEDRDLLGRAAVIGERFSLEELGLLAGDGGRETAGRTALVGAAYGFLHQEINAGWYAFSHAVVHAAILERVKAGERSRLCKRLAEAAETEGAAGGAERALRVAAWWSKVEGEEARQGERRCYIRAAGAALEARAWEQAVELYGKVVRPNDIAVSSDEQAEASFGMGRALFMSGERSAAVDWFKRAFEWYRSKRDLERMLALATFPNYLNAGEPGFFDFHGAVLRALPRDAPQRGMVLAFHAIQLWNCLGDLRGAEKSIKAAVRLGRRNDDVVLQARSLPFWAFIDKMNNLPESALRKLLRAEELNAARQDFFANCHINSHLSLTLLVLGRVDESFPYCLRAVELAEKARDAFMTAAVCFDAVKFLAGWGRWDQAREMAERGLSAMPDYQNLLTLRAQIEYATGNFEAGDAYRNRLFTLQRRTPAGPWFVHICAAAATITRASQSADAGGLGSLIAPLRAAAVHPRAHPCIVLRAHLLLAFIGALTDEPALARKHHQAVLESPPLYLIRPYRTQRILGLAAHAFGDHEAAVKHLEEALRLARRFQDRPIEAMIQYELGLARLPEEPAGDVPAEARRCFFDSRDLAQTLGQPPLLARIERVLMRLSTRDGGRSIGHVHLSKREKQVLDLLAKGLTNKEIAARLGISPYTLVNHVHNIITKTGATNRTEAVSIATRNQSIQVQNR